MSIQCSICSKDLSPEKEVACDLCKHFVHSVCSGLSRLETQCLKSKDRKITFYCPECSDFKAQLKNMHTLTKLVQDLRDEVNTLKRNAAHDVEGDVYQTEKVVQELMDRERRKNNIVLFNITEANAGDKNDQVAADVTTCKEILSVLGVSPNIPIKPVRLGKFDPTKADRKRPIKIDLGDTVLVDKVIRNCKHLRTSTTFNSVGISKDRTPSQTAFYHKVRQELLRRKDAGETNIFIKYVKDMPTIVKSKSLN